MIRPVIVTLSWDDGHVQDLRVAELMRKYKLAGTFYVSPFDRELSRRERLTAQQTRRLARHFEIGAHTMSHPHLTELSSPEVLREMTESKSYLEELLGREVSSFCYPYGDTDKRVGALAREAGFAYARTTRRHATDPGRAPFDVPTTVHACGHPKEDLLWTLRFSRFHPLRSYRTLRWDEAARQLFDKTLKEGGVFHLWGHSWEVEENGDWERLEALFAYISGRADVLYLTNAETGALTHRRKLLLTAPYFAPKGGGLETYALETATRLSRDYGWDVVVAASDHTGEGPRVETMEGLKLYRLPVWWTFSNTPIHPLRWRQLRRIIREERPDLICAHTPVPFMSDMTAAASGRTPLVLTYHAATLAKPGSRLFNLVAAAYAQVERFSLSKARRVIAVSPFVAESLPASVRRKAVVVPNAVDRARILHRRQVRPVGREIVFAASLDRTHSWKGLDLVLEALAIANRRRGGCDLRLTVLGDGNDRARYVEKARSLKLGGQVTFAGYVSGDAKWEALRRADMIVMYPSTGNDAFPTVLVEAWASGLAVVASDIGPIPGLIKDGEDGVLVPPSDPKALASALLRVSRDVQLRRRMSTAGRRNVAETYNWDIQAEATRRALEGVLPQEVRS